MNESPGCRTSLRSPVRTASAVAGPLGVAVFLITSTLSVQAAPQRLSLEVNCGRPQCLVSVSAQPIDIQELFSLIDKLTGEEKG